MQTASSTIWTRVNVSVSNGKNHHSTSASFKRGVFEVEVDYITMLGWNKSSCGSIWPIAGR